MRERLDWEDVDHVLKPCLEPDPDEVHTCRPVLLQQRDEQVELLESKVEDRLHPEVQRLRCVELLPSSVLRRVRLQVLLRRELLELLPWPLAEKEPDVEELPRGSREHDTREEPVLVRRKEQEESVLFAQLE